MNDSQSAATDRADEVPWTHTPFGQPWWLDAVAPGSWGEVVVERKGEVAARLPYVVKERFGLRVLTQAPLTRFLGPWTRPADGKYGHRIGVEKQLMSELIEGLPPHDAFHANFAPAISNWLAFHWAGFDATLHYTYRLDDLADLDAVRAGFEPNVRNQIRKAQRELKVRTDLELDPLLQITAKTFGRQGLPVPFDDALAVRLDRACRQRGVGTIIGAVDAQERVHAACFVVHDHGTSYLLYGGGDPELRSSQAGTLIIWEAIRLAAEAGRQFDFLGSMSESFERRNRSFGARQAPYLYVSRERPHARLLLAARSAVGDRIAAARARVGSRTGRSART